MTEDDSRNRIVAVISRTPFTIAFTLALLVIAAATGTLFTPASQQPWYPQVATGIPSFADGRWWTVVTSPFFVDHPLVLITLLPLVLGGLGWAEWRFGSLRTIGLFAAGHLVGVLGAAGILALLASTGWPWAVGLTTVYDVGPSCGALTALVFAIATLPAPWRLRARIAVGLWTGISVLYLGHLHDLEHAVSMAAALAVSGWLPAFRRRAGRPSQREWRLIALSLLIAIGAIQVLDLVVPYNGPLGANDPIASFTDVAIDVVVIALIANGIRQGYRLAWTIAIVLGVFNVVTAAVVLPLLPLLVEQGVLSAPSEVVGLVLAPALFWLGLVLLLVLARGAFRVRLRKSNRRLDAQALSRQQLIERLQHSGGGTISWMSTWEGNRRIASGEVGAIAYQSHSGVAIMLGDPIVPAGDTSAALADFARVTQQAGLIPCVFSAGEEAAAARPEGWRSVIVAEDTIVDLPGLAFTGKAWGAARTALNRAAREGVEFRMVRLADEPWNVLAQVRAISEQWTGDKGLPEMRFTLGTVDEALDPEVLVGIAVDGRGDLHGVTSWLPVYGPADPATGEPRIVGWTLDLMRRRDGGFGPVIEFLIAASAQHLSEQGYEFISLSGAPLVRPAEAEAGPVDQVLEQIGGLIEPLYGFKSLHRFKQKFNPRHESLYLLYRDEGDLPRIGIALTRAYLPDASLRDLVASAASAGKPA
ncbi:bifunctional lysylphosphatidylglycerol flippase/synthetase MprF [Leucobacter sp. VD1]|uniref:bifunctional lysylphosphatidylglycerol flippase/synthetase MprF n=1 Tax=Leucobacter sp. VD1 TaxID=3080381 RepID=UPI00301A3C8C